MTVPERKLSDAIREVKNALADRDDVVVELREAQRTRLELLALDLEPVFAEVPPEAVQFDLVISNGLQPRLWIDMSAHVGMGRDRRTYRFVRDTRLGRSVLAESPDLRTVADQVTRYIAERLIERQRMIDGTPVAVMQDHVDDAPKPAARMTLAPRAEAIVPVAAPPSATMPVAAAAVAEPARRGGGFGEFLSGLLLVLGGAAVALIVLAIMYWDRLPTISITH